MIQYGAVGTDDDWEGLDPECEAVPLVGVDPAGNNLYRRLFAALNYHDDTLVSTLMGTAMNTQHVTAAS